MTTDEHFHALERLYYSAPIIAEIFPSTISITTGKAQIKLLIEPRFHHAAGATHSSVLFQLLDNAAFFATSSLEQAHFVLTSTFTTYFLRPAVTGSLTANGWVTSQTRTQLIGESVMNDDDGREICRGHGIFLRSTTALSAVPGYQAS